MTSKVFISYRRSDSAWATAALHAVLTERLGHDSVFKDLESIKPGTPWLETLNQALDASETTLVMIGPSWASCRPSRWRRPRIKSEGDWVRTEIARSLERDVPVVPVLVDGTSLPGPSDLPKDLRGLRTRQWARLTGSNYRADIDNLINRLDLRGPGSEPAPAVAGGRVTSETPLDQVLLSFLQNWSQWSFSPLRIKNWGGQQAGFDRLAETSTDEIRNGLQSLVESGRAKTKKSARGNALYTAV